MKKKQLKLPVREVNNHNQTKFSPGVERRDNFTKLVQFLAQLLGNTKTAHNVVFYGFINIFVGTFNSC